MSIWSPDDRISLQKLSSKTAVLLALTTGHRMQTLAAIDISNIEKFEDRIEIKIWATLKTSGPNRLQPNLLLPYYTEDRSICVATCLETYLKRTKSLRGTSNQLFISWKKPHKMVSTQTLSRWIKQLLEESGVDISKFTAYSTRHASTSAARRNGVSIDNIKRTTGWTATSTHLLSSTTEGSQQITQFSPKKF